MQIIEKKILISATLFLVSIGVGLVSSYHYWGFAYARPTNLLQELPHGGYVRQARYLNVTITAAGQVEVDIYNIERSRERKAHFDDQCSVEYDAGYYCLVNRAVLNRKLPFTDDFTISTSKLIKLFEALVREGAITLNKSVRTSNNVKLEGLVVLFQSDADELLYISVIGNELSGDSYPYYEWTFNVRDNLRKDSENMFWFDIAGIEGVEWYHISLVVFVLLSLLLVLGRLSVGSIRNWRRQKRGSTSSV